MIIQNQYYKIQIHTDRGQQVHCHCVFKICIMGILTNFIKPKYQLSDNWKHND